MSLRKCQQLTAPNVSQTANPTRSALIIARAQRMIEGLVRNGIAPPSTIFADQQHVARSRHPAKPRVEDERAADPRHEIAQVQAFLPKRRYRRCTARNRWLAEPPIGQLRRSSRNGAPRARRKVSRIGESKFLMRPEDYTARRREWRVQLLDCEWRVQLLY